MDESDQTSLKQLTWTFSGSLEVQSRSPITSLAQMLDTLSQIIEKYSGPRIKKPIVLAIYLLLGTHLSPEKKGAYCNYIYKASIGKRVRFAVETPDFTDSPANINWTAVEGKDSDWTKITFQLEIEPTIRNGILFDDLYNVPVPGRVIPPFRDLGNDYGIETKKREDRTFIVLRLG